MRRIETSAIRELVEILMKKYGAENKIAESRIIRGWEEVLGKTVSKYTRNLYIKDRTLYVSLSSSVARAELMMMKDEIIKKLNERAGKEVISKIILR